MYSMGLRAVLVPWPHSGHILCPNWKSPPTGYETLLWESWSPLRDPNP